jgi:hypothetical protein
LPLAFIDPAIREFWCKKNAAGRGDVGSIAGALIERNCFAAKTL